MFIEANGIRFGALAWGEGPLVLLFHGFPDTAHTWAEIGPAIARAGFRVVAPFLRGYAPTSIPRADTDSRTLGEDVVGLVRALGEDRARIVGHDWGAEAVCAAAALDPGRFERMATIAIPHRAAFPITPRFVWAARHFLSLRFPGAEARFAANDFAMIEVLWRRWSPTWRYGPADLAPVKQALAEPGRVHAALGYYRAAAVRTPAFLQAPVQVPSLAVAGTDDPSVPLSSFEAARRQYRAGYQIAAVRGGHFCHRESPRAVIDALVSFLR